ncbi:MAG: HNH endonuclease [Gemmatimonadetes bacterium]|nr:HNH endonuclease [Gemmatimonadota bacterium]MYA41542.1 HNH endonuclease [Gemmatimonadota bacterium]MYF07797.1 HNH endonuclease [Rhodospirillaceae bacterium]
MNEPRPPTAEEQLEFLQQLQRLLDEGSFVASYKFALLHAIADLCVLKGDDSGAELELLTSEIAERFIRLYWRQTAPFVAGDEKQILKQNTGRQAAVVRDVADHHNRYHGSLADLERSRSDWNALLRGVEQTIRRMPLWKLQTVGSERLEFLYQNLDAGGVVRLEPGVAYCFRAFYPMVTDIIEGAWSHFVQRHNRKLLGQIIDLRAFLFGAQRSSLAAFHPLLREVQKGRCFYCERDIKSRADVDHFIPWRLYSLDLGHNFVLAHQGCNSSKSDLLAAEEHLERWTLRNHACRDALGDSFDQLDILHDWPATRQVARWAYGQAYQAGRQVWVTKQHLRPLSDDWRRILANASRPAA